MTEAPRPLADLVFLNSFAKGDPKIVVKYISIFLRSNPTLLESIKEQIQKQNWADAINSAHSLKTQYNFMGCNSGEQLSRSIKNSIEKGSELQELRTSIVQLTELSSQLYTELGTVVDNMSI